MKFLSFVEERGLLAITQEKAKQMKNCEGRKTSFLLVWTN